MSSDLLAVEDADAGGAEDLVAGEGVEIGVERLHVHCHVRRGLRAVDQRHGAGGVRHVDDLFDRIDGAERVRDVRDGHHAGARIEQLLVLLQKEFAALVHGNDAQLRAFSSQSICQGTMLEWCSMAEMMISSPAFTFWRPQELLTRLMPSVVPRTKIS